MLRQHQIDMVTLALTRPYALWYSGTGSGKTYALLTYMQAFSGLRLIICPKPALHVFAEDWEKFGLSGDIITLDKGTSKAKQRTLDKLASTKRTAIVVVNYATARLLKLSHIPFTAVGADEAQKLGTHNSQTSLTLARECAHISHKVAMTGTPYTDGLRSVFGIVRWLDPLLYDNPRKHPGSKLLGDWTTFLARFCVTYIHNNIRIVSGYKNQDILADTLAPFTIRIRTEDVIDLPDVVDVTRTCHLHGETKRVYQELAEDAAADLGDTSIFAPHILQRIIRLQQLVCSGELLDSENNAITFDIKPREALLRQLNEELGTQPYVIFTRFKRDVDIVRSILNEDVALLTGDADTHQEWRDGNYRVLVANIASGSAAVRLERAQHVVFWSVGYSAIDYLQARGRINRDGQKARKIFFHHIVTSDTIDEQIYAALQTKLEASNAMDARL